MEPWCLSGSMPIRRLPHRRNQSPLVPRRGAPRAGFDHVIANMFLVPFGMKLGSGVTVSTYIVSSMIPVYIGNTLSGARARVNPDPNPDPS